MKSTKSFSKIKTDEGFMWHRNVVFKGAQHGVSGFSNNGRIN